AKLDSRSGTEKFAHEKFERTFEIGDANVLVDVKPFDLVKLRAVSGVEFIAPISRAGCDYANRRCRGLHGADLHSGRVCPEQSTVWEIKCVLLVARRMFGRCIERVEAVPFVFHIGTVCECESHSPKNFDRAIPHLRKRLKCAEFVRSSWKRDVDLGKRARLLLRRKLVRA